MQLSILFTRQNTINPTYLPKCFPKTPPFISERIRYFLVTPKRFISKAEVFYLKQLNVLPLTVKKVKSRNAYLIMVKQHENTISSETLRYNVLKKVHRYLVYIINLIIFATKKVRRNASNINFSLFKTTGGL